VIDGWLEADRNVPRKQRHTAKRIHQRLVDEHGADVAEVTVRQYVHRRKRELGLAVSEVFAPQVHAAGVEAEIDWGEALVVLGGVPVKVHLFVMRASFSGAAFCQASLVESQQAFLRQVDGVDGIRESDGARLERRTSLPARFAACASTTRLLLAARQPSTIPAVRS
jgi:hypothetical protein